MLLISHILVSLAAVAVSMFGKTKGALALLVASFASGIFLVIMNPATLGRFCLSGFALTLVSLAILKIRHLTPVTNK